jgi:hypothetical protein
MELGSTSGFGGRNCNNLPELSGDNKKEAAAIAAAS